MNIKWINHAGFFLQGKNVGLLCDPWLEGPIFNNGWELLVPVNFENFDFSSVTHIWFSHEHPDHFNPYSIKKILATGIIPTVLFQETEDKRVLKFCENLGLKVIEIKDRTKFAISLNDFITIGKNGVEDSWALFEIGDKKLLNLNDCIFSRINEIYAINKITGDVDVLLSNFSYAEKVGNYGDTKQRQATAKKFRELIILQANIFKARFVIPFASFKFFSHKENFYLNSGASTALDIYNTLNSNITAKIIIMFPGDLWRFGQSFNSKEAIKKYISFEKAINPKSYEEKIVNFDLLSSAHLGFVKNIKSIHGRTFFFKIITALHFPFGFSGFTAWVDDLNYAIFIGIRHPLHRIDVSKEKCDLQTSSPNILYLLEYLYGANTLMVNGRYQATSIGNLKLFVFSHIALMTNARHSLGVGYVIKNIFKIIFNLMNRLTSVFT
jgi:UDP-MurNAc hydroxylase